MQQNHYLPALSKTWRLLSVAERASWQQKASGLVVHNSMGQASTFSGFQLFVSRNYVMILLELPLLSTATVDRPFSDALFTGLDMRLRASGLFNRITAIRSVGTPAYSVLAYLVPHSSDYFKKRFTTSAVFLGSRVAITASAVNMVAQGNQRMLYAGIRARQEGYLYIQNVDETTGQRGLLQLLTDPDIFVTG